MKRDFIKKILDGDTNEVELTASLEKLSKMLAIHYGTAPIIIIDEYDTPIQEGHSKDFYDEIIGFMRNFFSGAFKDNQKSFLWIPLLGSSVVRKVFSVD